MGHSIAGSVDCHEQVPRLVVGHSAHARTEPQEVHVVLLGHVNPKAGRRQDLPASAPAMNRVIRPTRVVVGMESVGVGRFGLVLELARGLLATQTLAWVCSVLEPRMAPADSLRPARPIGPSRRT